MRVLQVSGVDIGGGAELVARSLHEALRDRGHDSAMAVGRREGHDPAIYPLLNRRGRLSPAFRSMARPFRVRAATHRGAATVARLLESLGEPGRLLDELRGREDFRHSATRDLLSLPPWRPDLLHCHNLHGGYFDLRQLPSLSHQVPVILHMHDAWLLSGHCAHSLGCERWKSGCGACPDLKIPPELMRDGTAYNWSHKQAIYAASRLHILTPCQWLADRVRDSILKPRSIRVIPNGLDTGLFRPSIREAVRAGLGLPLDQTILLFSAIQARRNRFKDYASLEDALRILAADSELKPFTALILGGEGESTSLGQHEIRQIPLIRDRAKVAEYLQATDIYVHAALADTFPSSVVEALCCGCAVVASAVGGIPEQVRSLAGHGTTRTGGESLATATGILVPPHDPAAMAAALRDLINAPDTCRSLGQNAASDGVPRFGHARFMDQIETYYREILTTESERPAE